MGFGKAFDKVQEVIMFSLIFSFLSYSVSLYINQCVFCLSFDQLLELSHQGNNRVVDTLVGDIMVEQIMRRYKDVFILT